MMKPDHIPYIKIFLSSPGDVNDERKVALEVIEQLPYRPVFRDRFAFRVVAWDKLGADTRMRASMTPQEAINRGLPRPSECHIVVVLFWSRMGTPFTHTDGEKYLSGTHWELLDALNSPADTMIFRRIEKPQYETREDFDQHERLQVFFNSDLFQKDGQIRRGINQYEKPEDFRIKFETYLEECVVEILQNIGSNPLESDPNNSSFQNENVTVIEPEKWPSHKSPFPGLRAFTEEDALIFFGRGRETDALVQQLSDSRFVGVVGASGSGKSSLIGAGLIPRLRANAIKGSKDWKIIHFTPDNNPFLQIADNLIRTFPAINLGEIIEARENLLPLIDDALGDTPAWTEILLFIDQFEELFTLTDENNRQAFVGFLKSIMDSKRVRAIVTLRHDFFYRVMENQTLAELFRGDSVFALGIPKRDALRQMIERPAERAEITVENELIEQILDDTGNEPGNLALMAYTLDELYETSNKHLTVEHYNSLGRIHNAIGQRAKNIYESLEIPNKEIIIKRLFRQLIHIDHQGQAARRRMHYSGLDDQTKKIIEAFADARLFILGKDSTSHKPTVEIAHEALIRSWSLLSNWLEKNQDELRIQKKLAEDAGTWQENNRDQGYLATGAILDQYETLFHNNTRALSDNEKDFLQDSLEKRTQQKNLRRGAVGTVITLAIIAIIAGIAAVFQQSEAVRSEATAVAESQISRSRELAASALNNLTQPDSALLLSLQALAIYNTYEARHSLLLALQQYPRLQGYLFGHTDVVQTVAYSPDGTRILSGGRDNQVIMWDAATREPLQIFSDHSNWVDTVAYAPDGSQFVSSSRDETAIIRRSDTGEILHTLEAHNDSVIAVAYSPNSTRLVTADASGRIMLWDTDSGKRLKSIQAHNDFVYNLAFSTDGELLASASADETARFWEADTLEASGDPLTVHDNYVLDVAFSDDGRYFVTTSADENSVLWDLDERQAIFQFPAGGQVRSTVFTPDSRRLIASDETGILYIWDTENGSLIDSFEQPGRESIRDMALHDDTLLIAGASDALTLWSVNPQPALGEVIGQQDERVVRVAYAPDGQTIASGGGNHDNTDVYLWDSNTGDVTRLTGHDAPITGLAYNSSNGRLASTDEAGRVFIWQDDEQLGTIESNEPFFGVAYHEDILALGSYTGEIVLWDVSGASEKWEPTRTIEAHDARISALAISKDGTQLASASLIERIQVHDMATGDLLHTLAAHKDTVQSVAFSPDGTLLASGSRDRTIRLWDTSTWQQIGDPLHGHEAWVMTVDFSPDGRLLASGDTDEQVLLWDIQTLRQIGMPLAGHTGWVNSVAFSPDGTRLASGGNDGQILHWIIGLEAWHEMACDIANRPLSPDEISRYFKQSVPVSLCND